MHSGFLRTLTFLLLLLSISGVAEAQTTKANGSANNATHWAFQPLRKAVLPQVKNAAWCRTPIDRFILAGLEKADMKPSPPADKRTLLRRVTYDLTGLPPTPQEVTDFLADNSPNAYEKVVDRLQDSPRYGERWGRHWLDVVHYGDTHGYDKDKRRDNAWPYRDYVIRAFNSDKPYGRFLEEQVAGDVLFPGTPDGIIATGFIAAGPWDFVGNVELAEGTMEKEKTRLLDRDDMVANTIATFNSVTIHCARCHNHKFDPIPQTDYYRLQAVFAGVERGDRPYPLASGAPIPPTTTAASPTNGYHSAIEARQDVEKWVQIDLGRSIPIESIRLLPARPTDFADTPGFGFPVRFRVTLSDEAAFMHSETVADHTQTDFPNPGDTPVVVPVGKRTARYVRVTASRLWKRTNDYVFALAEMQVLSGGKNIAQGAPVTAIDSIEAGRWSTRYLTDNFDSRKSLTPQALVYAPLPRKPRPIYVLSRGEVQKPGEQVGPGALSCLPGLESTFTVKDPEEEGQRRAALAHWLSGSANVLTWRSIVNRVWGFHFGRGIVDTPNDFGKNGSRPTHPELLDWLAVEFRESGQSLKQLHRLMVLSATYRQSSQENAAYAAKDGDNRLLWRMNRQRLDAEEVRDSVLAASGKLDLMMGGPGFELFQFKDDHSPVYDYTAPHVADQPAAWRRAVYAFTVRSVQNPFMECLDCADPNINTPVRNTTLTALQALALLNDPFMLRQAELFAERLKSLSPTPAKQIEAAYQLAFGRPPSAVESAALVTYAQQHGLPAACRLLFNANEFVFID